jgi:hypothetical protein
MIIESSDQVPRATLLKRFPIPRNFGVSPESRIERGKTWPAPAGATRVQNFEIYRYDPDSGENDADLVRRALARDAGAFRAITISACTELREASCAITPTLKTLFRTLMCLHSLILQAIEASRLSRRGCPVSS